MGLRIPGDLGGDPEVRARRLIGTPIDYQGRVNECIQIADEAVLLFEKKARDYGDAARELGPRAQFVDINRKVVKLKRAIWEGEELNFEGVEEICMDLIGHCLLTIQMLREDADH